MEVKMTIWICEKQSGKILNLSLEETLKRFNLEFSELKDLIDSGNEFNGFFFDEAIII